MLLVNRCYGNLQANCTEKKWRPPVREKWDSFAFSFCSRSHSFPEKKKKNEKDWGRDGGINKMANVLIQTVGEAELFRDI